MPRPDFLVRMVLDRAKVGAIHELPLHKLPLHTSPLRNRRNMTLPKIIGYLKMNSAKYINQQRNTPGIPVWQHNDYEQVIRDEPELLVISAPPTMDMF